MIRLPNHLCGNGVFPAAQHTTLDALRNLAIALNITTDSLIIEANLFRHDTRRWTQAS